MPSSKSAANGFGSIEAIERAIDACNSDWENKDLSPAKQHSLETKLYDLYSKWTQTKIDIGGSRPAVSVVMSTYNAESFLRQAVSSILDQTFADFEFIIIDDGSTDNSVKIIKSYNDPRIRLIHQTNHGLVYSLNKAIRLARADFIARIDGDDISMPSRLERELAVITSSASLGLVGSFFTYIDESGNTSETSVSPTKHTDIMRSFYVQNPVGHGTVMFRKSAFLEAGGYRDDYGPTEDFELWRRIGQKWQLAQIPESLYLYRVSEQSISNQRKQMQHKFTAKIINEQWRKTFILKRLSIIRDGKYYKNLNSPFASQIFYRYTQDQYVIAMELFARGHFKTGVITALGTIRLNYRMSVKLWRPAIGGFFRQIGLRERKT